MSIYEINTDTSITPTTQTEEDLQKNLSRAFFDIDFYKRQINFPNDDGYEDPFEHYINIGWKTGLNPSPYFDTKFYLARSPDVVNAQMNPLIHYAVWGIKEGRLPHPDMANDISYLTTEDDDTKLIRANFDGEFYYNKYPDVKNNNADPVLHYMHFGWRLGYDPASFFSTRFYIEKNDDVRSIDMNPFLHYLKWGKFEGRQGTPIPHFTDKYNYKILNREERVIREKFDIDYYLTQNFSLLSKNVDPIKHYIHFGWRLGLNPTRDFNTNFYVSRHVNTVFDYVNPFFHYFDEGFKLGSIPLAVHKILLAESGRERDLITKEIIENYFDRKYYLERYSDIKKNNIDPLAHYISHGYKENRDPAPWFSTSFYKSKYPNFNLYNVDPFTHYIIWGKDHSFQTIEAEYTSIATIDESAEIVSDSMIANAMPVIDSANLKPKHDSNYNPNALNIHWLIPNFAKGGGGHMTIFRMIHWLEYFGHKCTIWIQDKDEFCPRERYDKILMYYQFVKSEIKQFGPEFYETVGDAAVATSWDTVFHIDRASGFKRNFYFVQDFEPYFYARGSRSLLAEQTYELDFDCLCASPWLASRLREYGRWSAPFWLAYDREVYFKNEERQKNRTPRIAFYGRGHSERRCVELGLLALCELKRRGIEFEVDIFGTDHRIGRSPFPVRNHGVLNPSELGELYRECDIGICFSATNYSLVPQEMMACGLPIIEVDVESTQAIFPEGIATLCKPFPADIADGVSGLLLDQQRRSTQIDVALEWVQKHSWEAAARSVEKAIKDRFEFYSWQPVVSPSVKKSINNVKASIIIPTLNGGELFERVLNQITRQKFNDSYEIVVIDSGSTDRTVEYVNNTPNARCISINKRDFQHGRTRNLGIEESRGEFSLILTQDALPSDEFWLYNMVSTLEHFEAAAGAFGKHLAWPTASFYTKRDIEGHFKGFEKFPLLISKYFDLERWNKKDIGFRQILRYYSDNNSCMRKSVWREIPYPEIDYGEDQAWAYKIIEKGYGKVYAPNAVVYHSHDYTPVEAMERAKIESWFFSTVFNENLAKYDVVSEIDARNAEAERIGHLANLSREEIDKKRALNVAEVIGAVGGLYGVR